MELYAQVNRKAILFVHETIRIMNSYHLSNFSLPKHLAINQYCQTLSSPNIPTMQYTLQLVSFILLKIKKINVI